MKERFAQALLEGKFNEARDLLTKIHDPKNPSKKITLFKQLIDTALAKGDLNIALEALPFTGYKLQQEDLKVCKTAAREKGDMKTFFECSMRLGEDFSMHTWLNAGFSCDHVIAQLVGIIEKHVSPSLLSTAEKISLYAGKLSA